MAKRVTVESGDSIVLPSAAVLSVESSGRILKATWPTARAAAGHQVGQSPCPLCGQIHGLAADDDGGGGGSARILWGD